MQWTLGCWCCTHAARSWNPARRFKECRLHRVAAPLAHYGGPSPKHCRCNVWGRCRCISHNLAGSHSGLAAAAKWCSRRPVERGVYTVHASVHRCQGVGSWQKQRSRTSPSLFWCLRCFLITSTLFCRPSREQPMTKCLAISNHMEINGIIFAFPRAPPHIENPDFQPYEE